MNNNQLALITDADVFPGSHADNPAGFRLRRAARAVVLNDQNQVLLFHIRRDGYHKLPGGGIEDGESIPEALARELMEEIGCRAEVMADLGQVEEFRNEQKLHQVHYGFLARQAGELSEPHLEPGELAKGAALRVAGSIDESIALIEADRATTYQGKFIRLRELAFLRAAQSRLKS